MTQHFDVAIVGGGPSGSTAGTLIKKYAPHLRVGIFERETFPREHVGESLLPPVGRILNEIGVWDEVEAQGFPIKIGATYRWGTTDDLWDFNLLDIREIALDTPRPAKYEGWRVKSTWQVDRARFDDILLKRAAELGCEVHEGTAVSRVNRNGETIEAIELADGGQVTATHYIDASGNAAVLRKGLGIEVEEPPSLRNIAIWDHWDNAEWAVSVGLDATRIQIASLGYGWLWVIPISATRTSIGLVCPADYYKKSGRRPEQLYAEAVRADKRVATLIAPATQVGNVRATKDWSFLAKQMTGPNWFLVGESAGFADPILSAGITMSLIGALECACTILELHRGEHPEAWLKSYFESRQAERVRQHIQFANFWYSANAHFTDLVEYTSEIARLAGLQMDGKTAWQWLGTGGFVSLETAGAGLAGHTLEQIANLQQMMFVEESEWLITKSNVFDLDLQGAQEEAFPVYHEGRVHRRKLYRRDGAHLPVTGAFRISLDILSRFRRLSDIVTAFRDVSAKAGPVIALSVIESLETMTREGWVRGSYDPSQPLLRAEDIPRRPHIDWNRDSQNPNVRVAEALRA